MCRSSPRTNSMPASVSTTTSWLSKLSTLITPSTCRASRFLKESWCLRRTTAFFSSVTRRAPLPTRCLSQGVANTYAREGPRMTHPPTALAHASIPQPADLDALKEELHDLLGRTPFAGELVRIPLAKAHAVA